MKAILYSKYNCPNCDTAKTLLNSHNVAIEERKIGDGYTKEELLEVVPHAKSVPQVFINDSYVGGLPDLKKYLAGNS